MCFNISKCVVAGGKFKVISANFRGVAVSPSDSVTQSKPQSNINNITKKEDIYAKWPMKGLAYTNEIGEILRPVSPLTANILWVPSIWYVGADIADKYKHDEKGKDDPCKHRALRQFSFQLLASVFAPTLGVKAGEKVTNIIASKGKSKLSFNDREKYNKFVTSSMNQGEHEKFLDGTTGLIDREKFSAHIMGEIGEVDKHKNSRNKMFAPIEKFINVLKSPFEPKPKSVDIKNYVSSTVDDVMDIQESLLKNSKPKNVSDKLYKRFLDSTKDMQVEEKKSAAFNVIKKVQNKKIFKNNLIKSFGGLVVLSVAMNPMENFIKHTLIKDYIGPAIDSVKSDAEDGKVQPLTTQKQSTIKS